MRRCAMGLDLGGGGVRCLLLDLDGGPPVVAQERWSAFAGTASDLDLEAIYARIGVAARAALAKAGPVEVPGVAVTAVRFGSVVLDRAGHALLAASNRDGRASAEAIALAQEAGVDLQQRTGHWPLAIATAARLRALARSGRAEAVHRVLALNDWVAWRLCGEIATDRSQAGVTGLWNLAEADWDAEALARAGARREWLPPVRSAGERLGSLHGEGAEHLGLPVGTPVAVAGGDTQCALLGMGVTGAGAAGAVCGTTLPIQGVVREPRLDGAGRLWLEPHLVPGHFVLESNAGTSGEALDWLGQLLFRGARNGAARLLAEASSVEAGANGKLSSLGAQRFDARAMVFPAGVLALSHLLGEAEGARAGLARAAAEGAAYGVRVNLEQLRGTAAPGSAPLRCGGGLTRSRSWAQLLADVLGEPVEVATHPQSSALGAALCAAVGAAAFASLVEAAAALPEPARTEPDAAAAARYAELYPRWCAWREAQQPSEPHVQGHALRAIAARGGAAAATARAPRPRILVTADLDDEALSRLASLGEVTPASYRKLGRLLAGPKLVEALAGYAVFVTEIDLVDAASLLALPELRVVAACRGDAVNVDAEAAARLGVPVLHAPGRNADAVADLTLAFLLALARKLPEATVYLRDPAVKAGDLGAMGRAFASLRGRELWRKTVGLVGLGAVGRKVAERLLPFGAELIVYDPWLPEEAVLRAGAEPVSLEALLARSDFVSLHAAVSESSRGLIGAGALGLMKRGACLVNTARAALVDEDALAKALSSGHLAGAGLDVFSVEPPGADHPLLAVPGVIATPHIGGNTLEIGAHQGRIVGDDLARLLRGERPRHLVRPEVWEGYAFEAERRAVDAPTRAWLLDRPAPSVTDLQRDKGKGAAKK